MLLLLIAVVVVVEGAAVGDGSTLAVALLDNLLLLLFWFCRRGLMPGDLSGMFGHLRGYKENHFNIGQVLLAL